MVVVAVVYCLRLLSTLHRRREEAAAREEDRKARERKVKLKLEMQVGRVEDVDDSEHQRNFCCCKIKIFFGNLICTGATEGGE